MFSIRRPRSWAVSGGVTINKMTTYERGAMDGGPMTILRVGGAGAPVMVSSAYPEAVGADGGAHAGSASPIAIDDVRDFPY